MTTIKIFPARTWSSIPFPFSCRIQLDPVKKGVSLPDDDCGPEENDEHGIRCSTCGYIITTSDHAAVINNSHEHTFFNPAGIVFELRCFKEAAGVYPQGEPSNAFSWFAGYTWQMVLCRNCHRHMGWRFSGGGFFLGLIKNNLRQD